MLTLVLIETIYSCIYDRLSIVLYVLVLLNKLLLPVFKSLFALGCFGNQPPTAVTIYLG